MHGESKATNTLFAGIQMILPDEIAPAHRHVSSAIRFVLDGEGAYTAVDGEKSFMSPGDFVITANWAPHDHGNTSNKPMLWLDVLDFPAVNFYEASFADHADEATQETTRQDGDSLNFYGSGVLPDGAWAKSYTPVINYTYERTRPIVERMMQAGDIDKRHGARVHYANPVTGGPVLPTMGAWLAMLPKGFKGEPYRATDGTIFVCVEGEGTTTVDGKVLELGSERRLRGAAVEALPAQCAGWRGAVLDLRSPGAKSARHLARGAVKAVAFTHDVPPQRVVFASGALSRVGDEATRLKIERALVVATPGSGARLGQNVSDLLGARAVGLHAQAVMHVPKAVAEAGLEAAQRKNADGLIAVGGGSAIGLAKAIALETGLPILAVPTTYSGSEANADFRHDRRRAQNHRPRRQGCAAHHHLRSRSDARPAGRGQRLKRHERHRPLRRGALGRQPHPGDGRARHRSDAAVCPKPAGGGRRWRQCRGARRVPDRRLARRHRAQLRHRAASQARPCPRRPRPAARRDPRDHAAACHAL